MTSQDYLDWVAAGKPDSGLALPLAQLRDLLRTGGYTVYDEPDDRHQKSPRPQDHTQYSVTGWPHKSPRWWRHAIDIMPNKGGRDLYNLGQYLVRDRRAGLATWIKYVNVPTSPNLTGALHHSWEPNYAVEGSDDIGHIHVSSVTGVETMPGPYDPFGGAVVVSAPGPLDTDGKLGPLTIRAWQHIMGTTVDGVITPPPGRSELVAAVQRRLDTFGAGLDVDGQGIQQGGPWSHTTQALQRYLGTTADGLISAPVSDVVRAVQGRLNLGWF